MFITHSYGTMMRISHQKTWYIPMLQGFSTPKSILFGTSSMAQPGSPGSPDHDRSRPRCSFQIQSCCKEPACPTMDHDTWGEALGRSRALDALDALATKRKGIVVASPEYMVQMVQLVA